ncbi:putative beta-galactosidase [Hibiscus syriacus]|uniref:Beta-galactosidase n=1 Tax=Hibiscus syriacus TaxID=106335 RepID=A0A6A2XCD2_HIBSY|nr:putative beta-galactosidase [Hibiscus syriacus]
MFFFFFLLSFIFLFFSFHYNEHHNQQQQVQEEGKPHNESTLLNDTEPQTRENDSTHLPHSLLLEIMPPDSAKWASLFTGENQQKGDVGRFGLGRVGSSVNRVVTGEDQRTKKKKKKRGKKKRLNSKSQEENGEERCSFSEDDKKKRKESGLVCLYPFTSTGSATQRKIKQQYDQLVKCHEDKGLTLIQVGDFANCLIEARIELQHKFEVIKCKFTITKALLFKADRSSFDSVILIPSNDG